MGAVQILIYAVEIVPFDEVSRKKMRKQMYTKTFRISQTTTLASLKTTACEYWGLIEKDFMLYQVYQEQEKTEPKDLADEMDSKVTKLVDQLYAVVHSAQNNNQDFSSGQSKNAVNKDANGNTLATFYLGKREKNNRNGDKRE